MKTLLANMRHAVRNGETVTIGGGQFSPAELHQALADISEARDALKTAADIIKTARPRFPKSIRNGDTYALNIAAVAVSKALDRFDA